MERAFHDLGRQRRELSVSDPPPTPQLKRAYGLRPELLAMSNAWRFDGADHALVAAKGSPAAIVDLCHVEPEARGRILELADEMAEAGMRVLGVAKAAHPRADLPQTQHEFAFGFVGLVGLSDPLRPSVPGAIEQCRAAGIRVLMATGDYPTTARAIAVQAGLVGGETLTGTELEALSEDQLAARLPHVSVFARIQPAQKLRISEAFKAQGEIFAMTGDGVNDAPSLKAAHIGIAMRNRGADVAREASALVLLDEDFGSIVKAIAFGRRVYDNLRKAIGFIVAVHVPIAGLVLINRSFEPSVLKAMRRPNLPLVLVTTAVLAVLGGAIFVPWMQGLIRFGPIPPLDLVWTATVAMVAVALMEGIKAVARPRHRLTAVKGLESREM